MTKEQFETITQWQRKTFPLADKFSTVYHLKEEIEELSESLNLGEADELEFADCLLLLFSCADHCGMSYQGICNAIDKKMEINKKRNWGSKNDKGYQKHK